MNERMKHASQEDEREYEICRLLDFGRVAAEMLNYNRSEGMCINRTIGQEQKVSRDEVSCALMYFTKRVAEHKL